MDEKWSSQTRLSNSCNSRRRYHQVDQFTHGGDIIYVWRGEVEEVPVVFLQPDNGHFDVGCIYGRGDDHKRFEYFSAAALAYFRWRPDHVPDVIHGHDWSSAPTIYDCERQLGKAVQVEHIRLTLG